MSQCVTELDAIHADISRDYSKGLIKGYTKEFLRLNANPCVYFCYFVCNVLHTSRQCIHVSYMLVNSYYVSCLHFLLVFGFFLRLENSLKEKFDVASQRHPTEIEPVEKNGIVARCLSNVIAGLQNLWLWKPVQGRGSTT